MTSVLLGMSGGNRTGDQELLTSKAKSNGGEDEARAFLTFASGDGEESSTAKGLCQRRRLVTGWQFVTLTALLVVLVGALAIAITCLELYHQREVVNLQSDVAALRRDVDALKHRVQEHDLLRDLKAFEDAVYAEEDASEENGGDNNNDDDEEEDVGEDVGNGDDVDYYTDEENEPADEKRRGRFHENYEKIMASRGLLHKSSRTKRAISSASEYEVPVISESYGSSHNKTPLNSEGLRLYESLVAGGGKGDPQEITENPIKDYHRVSSIWPVKHHKKHHHEGLQLRELPHPYHRRRSMSSSTQSPAPVISRKSRVMETDTDISRRPPSTSNNRVRFHNVVKPTVIATVPSPMSDDDDDDDELVVRVYQEQREGPQATMRSNDFHGRKRPRNTKKYPAKKLLAQEIDETSPPSSAGRRRILPAADFGGNVSTYRIGHEHYSGNGRVRHPDGIFRDWIPSSWVRDLGMDRYLSLSDGTLEIKEGGLYQFYAQIHYLDEHDTNGYQVLVNGDVILQCTVTAVPAIDPKNAKLSSCHTERVLYLKDGDKLRLKNIDNLRYAVFNPTQSFFGLYKIHRGKIREPK